MRIVEEWSADQATGLGDPIVWIGAFRVYISALVPNTTTTNRRNDSTMASKDNIADGLIANGSFRAPSQSPNKSALSPKKTARKTRSKSIGPGGIGELEAPSLKALKESTGNRRKVCTVHVSQQLHITNRLVCLHPRRQVDPGLER